MVENIPNWKLRIVIAEALKKRNYENISSKAIREVCECKFGCDLETRILDINRIIRNIVDERTEERRMEAKPNTDDVVKKNRRHILKPKKLVVAVAAEDPGSVKESILNDIRRINQTTGRRESAAKELEAFQSMQNQDDGPEVIPKVVEQGMPKNQLSVLQESAAREEKAGQSMQNQDDGSKKITGGVRQGMPKKKRARMIKKKKTSTPTQHVIQPCPKSSWLSRYRFPYNHVHPNVSRRRYRGRMPCNFCAKNTSVTGVRACLPSSENRPSYKRKQNKSENAGDHHNIPQVTAAPNEQMTDAELARSCHLAQWSMRPRTPRNNGEEQAN